MDITKKAKDEIDARLDKIEDFIAKNGIGSKYLQKAKKTHRDVNLALAASSILAVVGIALWFKLKSKEEE
ncbi:hypothetical protein A33Q_2346 [Indibacter alkaliphilus LW1]|jgi:hypothetical protein|uniref:Uncharacterized protein n=1 Tax=Indibacter alkaliphilus (strain CCUG 57479 / KCTC 22604 / LW1) TaxID=1189612 RepID=S2DWY9_INDAL|nr:hypothetical protein [Indibacter alkaliphilus]EOZ96576.1 hypothetical protein A33Q_2346 [Indibacter alkaliphilus LW1]